MASEGALRKKLKARVEAYGGEIRAVSWLGRRSAPDVLCLFPPKDGVDGWTVWVETKAPKKGPTEAQAREHERLRNAGCFVVVVSAEHELDDWLPPL
jgi:hypothetical protein